MPICHSLTWGRILISRGTYSVVPRLAISSLPISLLEMQNLKPYLRFTESEYAFKQTPQVIHRHIKV